MKIGVLGHNSALGRLHWAGDNLGYQINFVMKHATGAWSIARPVNQQSSALPLYNGCPPPPHFITYYPLVLYLIIEVQQLIHAKKGACKNDRGRIREITFTFFTTNKVIRGSSFQLHTSRLKSQRQKVIKRLRDSVRECERWIFIAGHVIAGIHMSWQIDLLTKWNITSS